MPIPWLQLVKFAPSILSLTGDLLRRSRRVEQQKEPGIEARVRALETDLHRQAEALHALARQVEGLTEVLASVRRALLLAVVLGAAALLFSLTAFLAVLIS